MLIHYSISSQYQGNDNLGGIMAYYLTISDSLKKVLSSKLITECLHAIKNLPDEPRIIVIYSDYHSELNEFIADLLKDYTLKYSGTAVGVVASGFNDKFNAHHVIIPHLISGSEIKEKLKPYFVDPKYIS
jgi:hypothetical protein